MAEQVMESDVFEDSQSSMEEDFFSDSNVEFVTDDGAPIVPNAPEAKIEPQQTEQPAEVPAQGVPARSGLEADFFSPDGTLKDDALDFFSIGKNQPAQYQRAPVTAPVQPVEQDDTPQWKKDLDEQRSYEQTVKQNLMGPMSEIRQLVQQGYTAEQALYATEQKWNGTLAEHFEEKRYERETQRAEREAESRKSEMEAQQLQPKADANFAQIASELGGNDKAQMLLFSPELGGPIINFLYDLANPDKVGLPVDSNDLRQFWVKVAANDTHLRQVTAMAKSALQQKMWPDIVKRIRGGALAQAGQNAQARGGVPSSIARNEASPSAGMDALDQYLGGSELESI